MYYLLSLLTALFLILCSSQFNFYLLTWVCLIPWFYCLTQIKSLRYCFILSGITGILVNIGTFYWLVPTFITAGEPWWIGCLAVLLLSIYLSLYYSIFGLVFRINYSGTKKKLIYRIVFPFFGATVWVSLEYLRTYLFTGFPWMLLGYTQVFFKPIIQIAEYTSVYGVSFMIVYINIVLVMLWLPLSKRIKYYNLVIAGLFFCLNYCYGIYILTYPNKSKLNGQINISVLQGNINQNKKWDLNYEQEILSTYANLAKHSSVTEPDLIVWPESALPGYLFNNYRLYEWTQNLVTQTQTYHLIGTVHYQNNQHYNTAFLLGPKYFNLGKYAKIHLVPFGENIPWHSFLSRYIRTLNELGNFTSGNEYTVFTHPPTGVKFGVNICFESIFPDLIRRCVKDGAQIIINLTNDAWYLNTSAPYQHFTMSVFRAIENRCFLVRAANTGISGFIDPYGRVVEQTRIFTTTQLTRKLTVRSKLTLYTRFGDWFARVCTLLSFSLFMFMLLIGKSKI